MNFRNMCQSRETARLFWRSAFKWVGHQSGPPGHFSELVRVDDKLHPVVVFRGCGSPESTASPTFDEDYLRRREKAERAAAKKASSPSARRIHQDLAQAYAGLARPEFGENE